ncbi:ammonium transporter, partial [Kitasatospora sp. NPDC054795]
AGAVCCAAVSLKYRWGFDDSLDVVGVHAVGGAIGSLLIGLLATGGVGQSARGLFYGGGFGQLGKQAVGVAVVAVYSFTLSWLLGRAIQRTIGFRVPREAERSGIDQSEHAETAYDFTTVRVPGPAPVEPLTGPGSLVGRLLGALRRGRGRNASEEAERKGTDN